MKCHVNQSGTQPAVFTRGSARRLIIPFPDLKMSACCIRGESLFGSLYIRDDLIRH